MRLLACLLMPVAVLVGQSPQFRCDPGHTGRAAGPARVPHGLAWRVDTGGRVRGTPAASATLAIVGNDRGDLLAVSPEDGTLRWKRNLGTPLSSPALLGDLVLVMGRDNVLRALAQADGSPRWSTPLGQELPVKGDPRLWDYWVCSPAVAEGKVFVGSGDGAVYALDPKAGKVLWRAATGGWVRSTPAVVDGLVYAGSYDGKVHALDAATGAPRWTYDTRGAVLAAPAVAEGRVVVGSRSAAVFSLAAKTGALQWRSPIPNGCWVVTPAAIAEGKVVVGTSDERYLAALDLATGRECWRLDVGYRVFSAPVIQGGLVHVGTEGAYTQTVELATGLAVGGEFAEGPVHGGIVPVGERLLAGSDDHHLYGYRLVPPPEPGPAEAALPVEAAGRYRIGSFTLVLASAGPHWSAVMGSGVPSRVHPLGGDRLRLPGGGEGQLVRDASGAVTGLKAKLSGQTLELKRLP